MRQPATDLRVVVLTVPNGVLVTHHLVKHLNVVGVLVDKGPKSRKRRSGRETLGRVVSIARSRGLAGLRSTVLSRVFPRLVPSAFERAVRYERRYRRRIDRLFGGRYYESDLASRDFVEWEDLATHYRVPVEHVDNVNSDSSVARVREWNPDLFIIAGGRVIKQHVLDIPRLGTLNKHSSILPRHRGLDAEYWCLYYEDLDSLGVTVHFVDAGVDTGPIVMQRAMSFRWGDTPQSLRFQSELTGRQVLVEAVRKIAETGTQGTPQDASLATRNAAPSPQTDRELYQKLPQMWAKYGQARHSGPVAEVPAERAMSRVGAKRG